MLGESLCMAPRYINMGHPADSLSKGLHNYQYYGPIFRIWPKYHKPQSSLKLVLVTI